MANEAPDKLAEIMMMLDAQDRELSDTINKALETVAVAAERQRKVRAALDALTVVHTEEPAEFDGKLADAIRTVLRNTTNSMSPTEVRGAIVEIGYDTSKHTNILASIHSVLKRMADSPSKEVKSKERKDGSGTAYTWVGERPVTTGNSISGIARLAALKPISNLRPIDTSALDAVSKSAQRVLQHYSGLGSISERMLKEQNAVTDAIKQNQEALERLRRNTLTELLSTKEEKE